MVEQLATEKPNDVSQIPIVINAVDDASKLSVTSITPLEQKADVIVKTEKEVTAEEAAASTPQSKAKAKEEAKNATEKEEAKETLPDDKKVDEVTEKVIAEPKEKDAVQRRIDKLTKARREAERERDWEKAERLKLQEENEKLKAAVPTGDKPKAESFQTEAEFVEALTDWKIEQKLKVDRDKATKEKETAETKGAIDEVTKEVDAIMAQGREKYEDFNTLVLDENLKISNAMVETIVDMSTDEDSKVPQEDVFYYLGQHPDESEEIAHLPPLKAARRIEKIVDKLSAAPPSPPLLPPKKRTSNAPEPITPVATTGITEKDPNEMTPREYRAWRERNK